jgi:hypothetical protein
MRIPASLQRDNGNFLAKKPEYDDLKKIAQHLTIPLNKVREEVLTQLRTPTSDVKYCERDFGGLASLADSIHSSILIFQR